MYNKKSKRNGMWIAVKYKNVTEGIFLLRPNRFTAKVLIDGKEETVHVKNTGRCKEILIPGAKVILEKSDNSQRKTGYDLISVYKGDRLVNMDSMLPNKVFYEYIPSFFGKTNLIKPEKTFNTSRFDFYIEQDERKIFAEVKGVTLEEDGVVKFPDAPTQRGVKHIKELCKAVEEGFEAYIVFIIQMKGAKYFTPNKATHPEFYSELKKAEKKGVKIYAIDCDVKKDSVTVGKEIPVKF